MSLVPGTPEAKSLPRGKSKLLVLTIAFSSRSETLEIMSRFASLATNLGTDEVRFVVWDNNSWRLRSTDAVDYHSSPLGNIGFGAAVNRVHELYTYERILLLNADIEIDADLFRKIAVRNLQLPEGVIWSPTLVNEDGTLQTAPGSLFMRTPLQEVLDIFGFPARSQRRARPLFYLRGAVFSISRKLLERAGGFDEAFFLYGEEADLCFRLDGQCQLVLDERIRVIHHGSQGNKGKSSAALRHSYNARVLLHRRYSGLLPAIVVKVAVLAAGVAQEAKNSVMIAIRRLAMTASRDN